MQKYHFAESEQHSKAGIVHLKSLVLNAAR